MIDDINTKRTELANQMAAAGAAALDFNATAAVLAAIPDTEPQQYVAAGTPENIAAILPATISPARRMRHGDRPTEALVFDEPAATSGDAPDLQQLKALALAATPGHWHTYPITDDDMYPRGLSIVAENGKTLSDEDTGPGDKDAEFIAAANPAVVLDLIARIERAAAPAPTAWEYCPECGSMETAPPDENVELQYFCAACGQEWHSDIDYTDVVRGHLGKRVAHPATASGDELPPSQITNTTSARKFVDAWHRKHFPTDRTFSRYIMADPARSNPLAGDFAWQLAKALEAMEARDAATKPTADLSKLTSYTIAGSQIGLPRGPVEVVKLADVQSLLATKPAAAPAVPEGFVVVPKVPTAVMVQKGGHINSEYLNDYAPIGEQRYHLPMVSVWEAMLAAAPAAFTIGAAQTADQVRDHALEEAARICWELQARPEFEPELQDRMLKVAEDRIRALKRPTTTQNSEAAK